MMTAGQKSGAAALLPLAVRIYSKKGRDESVNKTIVSLRNVSKEFPGVKALTNVSLELRQGEVLALMGENGAGKSTLVKCLTGAHTPTSGEIEIDGTVYHGITPAMARKLGIGAVYQEFTLVRELPVVENMFMGNLKGNGFLVDKRAMIKAASDIFHDFGVDIDPNAMLSTLSPAMMQIVEIAKAVSLQTRVLILDEPTAPLTIKEVDTLFSIIRKLKQSGVSIIYISHRMEEIFEITDRVVVMRDGCYICEMDTAATDRQALVRAMIGRELNDTSYPHTCCASDEVVLDVHDVSGNGVEHISFQLHKGEILGFAGLVGAGRTELMSVLFGDVPKQSGIVQVNGRQTDFREPYQAIGCGLGLLPEDRKNRGLLLDKSVLANITLSSLKKYCRWGVINQKQEQAVVQQYVDNLRIKTPTLEQEAQYLSGGNQQKLIVAKWLATDSDILIFDEPTRGIDVGAKFEIYQLMHQLVESGKSIIMVSSDFEELTGMSDRIIVISEGHFAGEKAAGDFDKTQLLDLASGER